MHPIDTYGHPIAYALIIIGLAIIIGQAIFSHRRARRAKSEPIWTWISLNHDAERQEFLRDLRQGIAFDNYFEGITTDPATNPERHP